MRILLQALLPVVLSALTLYASAGLGDGDASRESTAESWHNL